MAFDWFRNKASEIERDQDGWPDYMSLADLSLNGRRIVGSKRSDRDPPKADWPFEFKLGSDEDGRYVFIKEGDGYLHFISEGETRMVSNDPQDGADKSFIERSNLIYQLPNWKEVLGVLENNRGALQAAVDHAKNYVGVMSPKAYLLAGGEHIPGIEETVDHLATHAFAFNLPGYRSLDADALISMLASNLKGLDDGTLTIPEMTKGNKYRVMQTIEGPSGKSYTFNSTAFQDWHAVLASALGVKGEAKYESQVLEGNGYNVLEIQRGAKQIGSSLPHSLYRRVESGGPSAEEAKIQGYHQKIFMNREDGTLGLYLGGDYISPENRGSGLDLYTKAYVHLLNALGITDGFGPDPNPSRDMLKANLTSEANLDRIGKVLFWGPRSIGDSLKETNPVLYDKLGKDYHNKEFELNRHS